MKTQFLKIMAAFAITASIWSCSDFEPVIFDGTGTTIVQFTSTSYSLPVIVDSQGTVEVMVNSTTAANTDRTIPVEVVADQSDAIMGSYTLPGTITIPANEYSGTMTINGTDVAGVDTTPLTLTIRIPDSMDYQTENATQQTAISIFQVCPIPADYLIGDYLVSDVSSVFQGANFEASSTAVTAPTSTTREFDLTYLGNAHTVTLDLICGESIFGGISDTGFTCGGGPIVVPRASANPGTYSLAQDLLIFVNYTVDAPCLAASGGARNVQFSMQKL